MKVSINAIDSNTQIECVSIGVNFLAATSSTFFSMRS